MANDKLSTTMSSVRPTPSLTGDNNVINHNPSPAVAKSRDAGNGDIPLVFSKNINGSATKFETPDVPAGTAALDTRGNK
jgi:hypothetical protein